MKIGGDFSSNITILYIIYSANASVSLSNIPIVVIIYINIKVPVIPGALIDLLIIVHGLMFLLLRNGKRIRDRL